MREQWESTFTALDRLMAQHDDESTVVMMDQMHHQYSE